MNAQLDFFSAETIARSLVAAHAAAAPGTRFARRSRAHPYIPYDADEARQIIFGLCEQAAGDEVGNEATFVSWRATAHGGKKKGKKGGKR